MSKLFRSWMPVIVWLLIITTGLWFSVSGKAILGDLLSLILGINVNLISGSSAEKLNDIAPDMVRLDVFPWDKVERRQGEYDFSGPDAATQWAKQNKLAVLGIIQYAPSWANGQQFETPTKISGCGIPDLSDETAKYNRLRVYPPINPGNFGDYAYQVAKRYPEVTHWQIWNEPNSPIFWPSGPDPREYAKLLKASYNRVKAANPKAQVVLGGISLNDLNYIDGLYRAGAQPYFDKMAVHLYNQTLPPDAYLANELAKLRALMQSHGDINKEIWLTELGWYTGGATNNVNEAVQGDYLQKVYNIARGIPYVGAVFWHTLIDCDNGYQANNPEHNYGIFHGDLAPKKIVSVMKGILLTKTR